MAFSLIAKKKHFIVIITVNDSLHYRAAMSLIDTFYSVKPITKDTYDSLPGNLTKSYDVFKNEIEETDDLLFLETLIEDYEEKFNHCLKSN